MVRINLNGDRYELVLVEGSPVGPCDLWAKTPTETGERTYVIISHEEMADGIALPGSPEEFVKALAEALNRTEATFFCQATGLAAKAMQEQYPGLVLKGFTD